MSRQRKRHLDRQPPEEAVRIILSEFVGDAGTVAVDRMSYDWRPDDLLAVVRLNEPIGGSVLSLFRLELARKMHALLPAGHELADWDVVVECHGERLAGVNPSTNPSESEQEW